MNPVHVTQYSIVATAAPELSIAPVLQVNDSLYIVPIGGEVKVPKSCLPAYVAYRYRDSLGHDPDPVLYECDTDFNGDGDCGTDADLDAFFAAYEIGDGDLTALAGG